MKSTHNTVPARFVKTMLEVAAEKVDNTDTLLQNIGIDPKLIDGDKPVSALLYSELHHRIIELVQDEWFGMLSGGSVPKGATRLLCQAVVNARDLEQAIQRMAEFFEICKGFKVKNVHDVVGDKVIIKSQKLDFGDAQEFADLIAATSPATIKATISAQHGFLSWLAGKHLPITDIYYPFAEHQDSHSRLSSNVHFHYEQAFFGHAFDNKYLRHPIVQTDESIEDFMRKVPYYGLIKRSVDESVMSQVKAILAKSIGASFPQASEVSELLHMSVTTLYRHLNNEGTSFQQLKNESRMEAAIHYLNRPEINTSAISEMLSFENPSTFYRAFKKWTGMPPGEYRKQLLAKTQPAD